MNIETIQAYITLTKDIVTILATTIAAVVAIRGYQTWKKQLHWKTQYELAQRLLRAIYRVRQALAGVRDWMIDEYESFQAMKEANVEVSPDRKINFIQSQNAVYNKRWQKAQEAFTELESVSLEAEAIWGQAFKESLEPLAQCARTLWQTIGIYLAELENPSSKFNKDADYKRRQIMYIYPGEKDNFFSDEITDAVRKIENFLKPYLKI